MADWLTVPASEVNVGDVIAHNKGCGRVNYVEVVKEIGHFASAAHLGKLRIGSEGANDMFLAPGQTVEVYR